MFENKNLCFKMAELLLDYGADINHMINPKEGLTILMYFCTQISDLDKIRSKLKLEVIKFLLEHCANRNVKSKKRETASDLAKNSVQSNEIIKLLTETKQIYFYEDHKVMTKIYIHTNPPNNECDRLKAHCCFIV